MDAALGKRLDYSVCRYRLDMVLGQRHARWLRGAVAVRAGRHEFHQHDGDRLIYHHPLVRYDVSTGEAAIVGLSEGALLLRSVSNRAKLALPHFS